MPVPSHYQQHAAATLAKLHRAFDATTTWVTQLSWWKFVIFAIVSIIAANIVQDELFSNNEEVVERAVNPKAKQAWDALTPSRQKEILRYFSWLKSDEARTRNVEKALSVLSGQEDRFMARTWKRGK